jgi:two-component system, NarL family, response regulator DegU
MESHELLRKTLKKVLDEDPDLEVIGDMGDGNELFEFLEISKVEPNMVIVDLFAPSLRGVRDLRKVKLLHPQVGVLVISMFENQEYIHEVLSDGADGYLIKKEANAELFTAINKIRKGGIYLPPLFCGNLVQEPVRVQQAWKG